jgi:hypothetical protein
MNLFFKSYKICLFFFMLITWETSSSCGLAKDSRAYPTPWIQEIKLPGYFTDIPNRSFYLNRFGHLFVGKDNGLTMISERGPIHWYMSGPVYVTGNGSDSAYYACKDHFGMLSRDDRGNYRDHTYTDRIPRAYREFEPLQLVCAGGAFFMNADKGIYCFDGSGFRVFPFPEQETRLYVSEGTLLLSLDGETFQTWTGEGFSEREDREGDPLVQLLGLLDARPDLRLVDIISRDGFPGESAEDSRERTGAPGPEHQADHNVRRG